MRFDVASRMAPCPSNSAPRRSSAFAQAPEGIAVPAILCFILAAVTVALYWQVRTHEFIVFDDAQYITENPHIAVGLNWTAVAWAFKSGYAANWHPLTWISHMLDVEWFGFASGPHHLVSALFHAANSVLVFLVFRQMTGATWRSAFVAGFFAWHPLHVESVAWASERKDVLSAFFFLLMLICYGRYIRNRPSLRRSYCCCWISGRCAGRRP